MKFFMFGIIIFLITFIVQILLIIKNQPKTNKKILIMILLAFVISITLGIIGFIINCIIYLGKDLSI